MDADHHTQAPNNAPTASSSVDVYPLTVQSINGAPAPLREKRPDAVIRHGGQRRGQTRILHAE